MAANSTSILSQLDIVARERASRATDPALAASVEAVKAYQQRRFAATYSDLLHSPRYAGAARFFLDELYGPRDFSERDAQFARVVPALVRLFPALQGRRITHAWGGPIDVSPSHLPQIGSLGAGPVHYAFGYTGNGVGPSHLAGRILSGLALGARFLALPAHGAFDGDRLEQPGERKHQVDPGADRQIAIGRDERAARREVLGEVSDEVVGAVVLDEQRHGFAAVTPLLLIGHRAKWSQGLR